MPEKVEEPVVESPVEAVPDEVVEKAEEVVDKVEEPAVDAKAVEVVDKVEEPGVDAKVVEGRIADLGPDLARSQLLEKIRRLEETKEGPDLGLGPGPGLEAAQGLVEVVTKEVVLNQGAEAVCLLRKTALGAVQGQDLVTGTVLNPKQDRENKRKILTVELKRSKVL